MSVIEYFYSAHSAFAYLGSARLAAISAATGYKVVHRPIDLNPVIEAAGGAPFGGRSHIHKAYFFGVEIQRWAAFRDLPILDYRPTYHDNSLDLPNGLIIAAGQAGADVDPLANAILRAHWVDDADIADPETLAQITDAVGLGATPLLQAASSASVQEIHQANTAQAIARHIFGSPTYFVNGEMFYGQDRLDLMEWQINQG